MARNQVMRLLNQADKGASGTSGAGGVLSRLWRQQLKDLGINIQRWNDLMYNFVTDPRNGFPPTKRDQQSARGNLVKELARPQMTWKVFMKAQRFLGASDMTIAIECNYLNGKRSVHSTPVNFGMPAPTPVRPNFIQQIRQEPSMLALAAMKHLQETAPIELPIYTELEDDAHVRGLIYELCNPFSEPFEQQDVSKIIVPPWEVSEQPSPGFEAGTEDFAGSYLGKRTYDQYLADTQQQVSNHEHHD
jgi:hypothetical protein